MKQYRIIITTYKDGHKSYKPQVKQGFWWSNIGKYISYYDSGEYVESETMEEAMMYIDSHYTKILHSTPIDVIINYIYKG